MFAIIRIKMKNTASKNGCTTGPRTDGDARFVVARKRERGRPMNPVKTYRRTPTWFKVLDILVDVGIVLLATYVFVGCSRTIIAKHEPRVCRNNPCYVNKTFAGRQSSRSRPASGPALATDEAKAETHKLCVSRSGPCRGINGHHREHFLTPPISHRNGRIKTGPWNAYGQTDY